MARWGAGSGSGRTQGPGVWMSAEVGEYVCVCVFGRLVTRGHRCSGQLSRQAAYVGHFVVTATRRMRNVK